jgi:Flp pilus assembly protein TadG
MNWFSKLRRWLSQADRREFERDSQALVAFYWSGGAMCPRRILNISEEGAFVESDVRWCPGTLIQLRIQEENAIVEDGGEKSSFVVDGLVVRRGEAGFALQFLFDSPRQRKAFRMFLTSKLKRRQFLTPALTSSSQSGHSLVEFALLIPLLFLLIVNVVNFGAFFYAWITVANAARTGAQYRIMGGATVNSPKAPTATQVYNIISTDTSSLHNSSSLAVRVCTNTAGTIACQTTGSGTFTNPPADTRAEANLFVTAWVDVLYTYQPLIPAFNFPGMGIHATLPPTQIHRQAVMRMLQ